MMGFQASEPEIASAIDSVVSTWDIEPSNDLSAYKNCTRRRQPLCKAYSDYWSMT